MCADRSAHGQATDKRGSAERFENLREMSSHRLEAILARIERLVREPVAFELSDDAVVTGARERYESLAEHVRRACPARDHDDEWRALFSAFNSADVETRGEIEVSGSKLGASRGKHLRGRKTSRQHHRMNLYQLDLSADELSDESDAECYVGERSRSSSHRSAGEIFEREHRPHSRICAGRNVRALVRVPDAGAIAIVLETLEHLEPILVTAKESKPRHSLEPHECEWNVCFDRIA